MLLKYAYNDLRSHKWDTSFFEQEIIHYLMDIEDNIPKENVTVLAVLAVNISPVPDAMFGNLKLRWCKDPILYANSTVRNVDYETGQIYLNENVEKEKFPDLRVSYLFKFNSVQFLLLCWDKSSDKIEQNNIVLECQYPYCMLKAGNTTVTLAKCTDEFNYHHFEHIHVRWDGLFEVISYICFLASLGLKVTILFSVILNFLIFPVSESLNLYSNSSTHSLMRYKSIKQLKTKIQEDIY
mgnify:CR=1 FL=1